MQVTVEIPDEIAPLLAQSGQDLSQAILEALALEAFRQRRISAFQLRKVLGVSSRWGLDAFLKERRIETYTAPDFDHDMDTIERLNAERQTKRPAW